MLVFFKKLDKIFEFLGKESCILSEIGVYTYLTKIGSIKN